MELKNKNMVNKKFKKLEKEFFKKIWRRVKTWGRKRKERERG